MSVGIQIGVSNGANDRLAISLGDLEASALGLTAGIDTVTNAQLALTTVNGAIQTTASRRAGLGALQNRLESVVSSIDVLVENLTSAESRIRDADIAAETANLTKAQILVQAGTAVLSQANQVPMLALQLLE